MGCLFRVPGETADTPTVVVVDGQQRSQQHHHHQSHTFTADLAKMLSESITGAERDIRSDRKLSSWMDITGRRARERGLSGLSEETYVIRFNRAHRIHLCIERMTTL